ncbi:MAG: hypothetical protein ABUU24_06405, partial [Variovorax sp.]
MNLTIVSPTRAQRLAIQTREQAFYWSACAEGFLRKHGILNVVTTDGAGRDQHGLTIVTRETLPVHIPSRRVILEGPIAEQALGALG